MPEDPDPPETQEWLDALDSVVEFDGRRAGGVPAGRADDGARTARGGGAVHSATTPYVNTIPVDEQPPFPGDLASWSTAIRSLNRWNAVATVLRANKESLGAGRAHRLVPVVGHAVRHGLQPLLARPPTRGARRRPAVRAGARVARASTRGRSSRGGSARSSCSSFRQEVGGDGLSSYPHPWLMPEYWQFPTVSMGLGPLMAIYQARFLKYLDARGLADTADRHVWAFLGDGEMDEPESLGAISMASREKLDNLIFVVNCNLQRLDGPVRGNGKIIQELEGIFRGAGWNVIKVIWGSGWDPLLAADKSGLLLQAHGGVRRRRVPGLQVQERRLRARALLRQVPRAAGPGPRHDRRRDLGAARAAGTTRSKVYAAYKAAVEQRRASRR